MHLQVLLHLGCTVVNDEQVSDGVVNALEEPFQEVVPVQDRDNEVRDHETPLKVWPSKLRLMKGLSE